MRANEFIKKFGIEHSKDVANGWITNYENTNLDDLKRYVDAYELVASWGGLADAKVAVKVSRHKKYLKRAIADVESCQ